MPSPPQNGKTAPPHKRPGRQMALLLVTAGVSFALGMTVGRNTAPVETVVKIKVPADRIQPPRDDLTFYKTLPTGAPPALGSGINRLAATPAPSPSPAAAPPEKAPSTAPSPPPAAQPPAAAATAPQPTAADGGTWQLQVAAVPKESDARALCKKLRGKGYPVHFETASVKGKTWYRVYVGPYESASAAKAAASRLSAQEHLSAIVRKR